MEESLEKMRQKIESGQDFSESEADRLGEKLVKHVLEYAKRPDLPDDDEEYHKICKTLACRVGDGDRGNFIASIPLITISNTVKDILPGSMELDKWICRAWSRLDARSIVSRLLFLEKDMSSIIKPEYVSSVKASNKSKDERLVEITLTRAGEFRKIAKKGLYFASKTWCFGSIDAVFFVKSNAGSNPRIRSTQFVDMNARAQALLEAGIPFTIASLPSTSVHQGPSNHIYYVPKDFLAPAKAVLKAEIELPGTLKEMERTIEYLAAKAMEEKIMQEKRTLHEDFLDISR